MVDFMDIEAFLGDPAGFPAHPFDELRLKDEALHGESQGFYIARRHKKTVHPRDDRLPAPRGIGRRQPIGGVLYLAGVQVMKVLPRRPFQRPRSIP